MIPSAAIIFHGYRWPSSTDWSALLASLSAASSCDFRVVEAREDHAQAIGAAALVNRAAAGAREDVLLVAEPCLRWPVAVLETLVEATGQGLAFVRPAESAGRPRIWAVARATFERLGGLDERLWSIGEVEDLLARGHVLGIRIREITGEGSWIGAEPYPLPAHTRAFLEVRNRLMTAFKTASADELGRTLAITAAEALAGSWRAAGIAPTAFRFGSRERPRIADEAGTLWPLLALDSLYSEVPALVEERRALAASGARFSGTSRLFDDHGPEPAPMGLLDTIVSRVAAAWR